MMKNAVVLFILLLCPVYSFSQPRLTGSVTASGQPVSFATITLLPEQDTTHIKYTTSDSLGNFSFEILTPGNYTLAVRMLSFEEWKISCTLIKDTAIQCALTPDKKYNHLSGVTVSAKRPEFERKRDRFIFNLENSPLVAGSNVWDVLKQTPMVIANESGNFSVLGTTESVTVFINRRRFALTGTDLIRFLKDMPSGNIVRIEILTIPPPFYDANGPVIDIILKHMDINGMKGNVSLGYEQAQAGRGNGSVSIDYNNNNYNQSFYISGADGNYFKGIDKTTLYKNTGESIYSTFRSTSLYKGLSGYTDIKYSLSPVLTTGVQVTANVSGMSSSGTGIETTDQLYNDAYRQTINLDNSLVSANAFLKYNSEKKEQYFELSTDYLYANRNQDNEFIQDAQGGGYKAVVPQNIRNISVKADFSRPVYKKIYFEAGAKMSYSVTGTPYEAYDLNLSEWNKLDDQSAQFKYEESIQSGYVTFSKDLSKKWSAKVGVRVENTNIKTNTTGNTNQENKNNYTYAFPIGYINYTIDKNSALSLTSKINSSRPEYYTLNPSRLMLGSKTVTEGNPYLKPTNGGIAELVYSYKHRYYVGFSYAQSDKLFTQINTVIPPDTLLTKWENWGKVQQVNVWFYTQRSFLKGRWTASFYSNLLYYNRSVYPNIEKVAGADKSWQLVAQLNNNFSLTKQLSSYLNISFNTPDRSEIWSSDKCNYRVDLGATYKFTNSNWKVNVYISDMFKYVDRNVYVINENAVQKTTVLNNNDSRSIRLVASKSFGNMKTKNTSKRAAGNEEEKNRL